MILEKQQLIQKLLMIIPLSEIYQFRVHHHFFMCPCAFLEYGYGGLTYHFKSGKLSFFINDKVVVEYMVDINEIKKIAEENGSEKTKA